MEFNCRETARSGRTRCRELKKVFIEGVYNEA